ncbi:MAG: formate dehydrogenase accessory sulfurtransferase FdhD [Candidatus Baldrarchaeia archaeon]
MRAFTSYLRRVRAKRIDLSKNAVYDVEEIVVVDQPVFIRVNGKVLGMLIATPLQVKELAIGWLLTRGILKSPNDILEISLNGSFVDIKTSLKIDLSASAVDLSNHVHTTEEYVSEILKELGNPFVKSNYMISANMIMKMVEVLSMDAKIFKETGGTHCAALFSDNKLVAFSEDAGRYNAVDKVIGAGVFLKTDFSKSVLISSGRQNADMVMKVAMAGIPILVSVSAPLLSGVITAERTGVTLICFARENRMNLYTYPERVHLS